MGGLKILSLITNLGITINLFLIDSQTTREKVSSQNGNSREHVLRSQMIIK